LILLVLFIHGFDDVDYLESKKQTTEPIKPEPKTRKDLKKQMLSGHACPCGYFAWQQCMFCDDRGCKYCSHFKYEFDEECKRLNL
jgi:hypothetical protein